MKHVRKHHFVILPLLLAGIVASWVVVHNRGDAEATSPACPTGTYVSIDNAPYQTSAALIYPDHPHTLSVIVPNSMSTSMIHAYYFLDTETNYIGQGVNTSGSTNWPMTWYSQVTPIGSHTVSATLYMSGGSCTISQPSYANVNNPSSTSFGILPNPTQFNGYTNQPADFTLVSKTQDTSGSGAVDITPWTMFQKSAVNVGSVSPQDYANVFHFFSGPAAGQGSIHILAYYGGVVRPLDIPVSVYAQPTSDGSSTNNTQTSGTTGTNTTSTAPQPTGTTSTNTTSNTSTSTTTSSTTSTTPPPSVAADSPIRTCIIAKITQARFDAINSGQSRPTTAEFAAMQLCFAPQNFEVPSNFVTVAPNKTIIKAQPVSEVVTVATAATVTTKVNNNSVDVLKFSGKAKPNSIVLLYLFSEPLVISTSSNADGEWSYSLKDPMAPGKHEAYALVDKGSGTYERSSVFGFAIAKASAASSNPNGYSLKIEPNVGTATDSNSATMLYVGGIAGLVVVTLAVLTVFLVRRKKNQDAKPEVTPIAPVAPAVAETAAPTSTPTPPVAPEPAATPIAPDQPTVITPTVGTATPPATPEPTVAPIPAEPATTPEQPTPPTDTSGPAA
jgi:hypothetical protein